MKIENIYDTIVESKNPRISFDPIAITQNNIYGTINVEDDNYQCVVSLVNEKEIFIGFDNFIAMNEIRFIVEKLQIANYDTLKIEYVEYTRNSRFGIVLKQLNGY